MSYEEKIITSSIVDRELGPVVREDRARQLARQADAEVERLRGEVEQLKIEVRETNSTVDALQNAYAKVLEAAHPEDPIALIEAGKKLPRTKDGVRAYPGMKLYPLHPIVDEYDHEFEDYADVIIACNVDGSIHADEDEVSIALCYSSPQLAREAKEKGDA